MLENLKGIAADIDMTLTHKGGDLPQITKEAFNMLHRSGVLIGLATGRHLDEKLKNQGKAWGLDFEFDFLVALNGGEVYDRKEERFWSTEMLSTDEMKKIICYMLPLINKYTIGVNAEGGNHSCMNISQDLIDSGKRHGWVMEDKTGDIDGFCDTPCFKMLFRCEPVYEQEVRDTFLKEFGKNYQIIGTFPGTVEIMRKGIDKGSGLAMFASWKGLSTDQFMTFGDNENDNTMLSCAGCGVCLKDGAELSKACADEITEYSCLEGGVGHYLFDHVISGGKYSFN